MKKRRASEYGSFTKRIADKFDKDIDDKEKLSREIQKQVDDYLKGGGEIQKCKIRIGPPVSTEKKGRKTYIAKRIERSKNK